MSYQVRVCEAKVINTKVIATKSELDQCLRELLVSISEDAHRTDRICVVGLDIAKDCFPIPSHGFFGSGNYQVGERVAILKLCYESTCLIIQLQLLKAAPCSLSNFLQLNWISFAGVGIKHCLEALEMNYGIKCRNAIDLGQLTASHFQKGRYEGWPLMNLVNLLCLASSEMKKLMSSCHVAALSYWGATTLSEQQIEAATFDAFACFLLGKNLSSGRGHPYYP